MAGAGNPKSVTMKRVRVAPNQYVSISDGLVQKAARVFVNGLTDEQIRNLKAVKAPRRSGVMVGGNKPFRLSQPKK